MEALERLKEFDIKPSVQRIAIMEYLINNLNHPAVDEIYTALSPKIPTLSKTTVYNTLKLFAEHEAVKMLTIDERYSCFDIDTSNHSHFFCKQCNKIEDFHFDITLEGDGIIDSKNKVTEVHMYYKGICAACLESNIDSN